MKKISLAILLSALTFNAFAAPAANSGIDEFVDLSDTYVVGSYGTSNSPYTGSYFSGAFGVALQAVPDLYVEASYGHQSMDLTFGVTENYANKFGLSGVYLFPVEQVDRLSLVGKLGANYTIGKLSGVGYSATNSGLSLTYGVGAQYEINDQIDVRAMYENIGGVGITASSLNAGVVYHF